MSHGRNGHILHNGKNYFYKVIHSTSIIEVHKDGETLFSFRFKDFTEQEITDALTEYLRAKEHGKNRLASLSRKPTINEFDGVDTIYPD